MTFLIDFGSNFKNFEHILWRHIIMLIHPCSLVIMWIVMMYLTPDPQFPQFEPAEIIFWSYRMLFIQENYLVMSTLWNYMVCSPFIWVLRGYQDFQIMWIFCDTIFPNPLMTFRFWLRCLAFFSHKISFLVSNSSSPTAPSPSMTCRVLSGPSIISVGNGWD